MRPSHWGAVAALLQRSSLQHCGITHLTLMHCSLGNDVAPTIVSIIVSLSLQSLDLAYNVLGTGVVALCDAICDKRCDTLRALCLKNNKICGVEDWRALSAMFTANKTLREFSVAENIVPQEVRDEFANAIARNQTCTYLDAAGVFVGLDLYTLWRMIESNLTLLSVTFVSGGEYFCWASFLMRYRNAFFARNEMHGRLMNFAIVMWPLQLPIYILHDLFDLVDCELIDLRMRQQQYLVTVPLERIKQFRAPWKVAVIQSCMDSLRRVGSSRRK
jgi:hypothetical protein